MIGQSARRPSSRRRRGKRTSQAATKAHSVFVEARRVPFRAASMAVRLDFQGDVRTIRVGLSRSASSLSALWNPHLAKAPAREGVADHGRSRSYTLVCG